jgi:hypothetical protein
MIRILFAVLLTAGVYCLAQAQVPQTGAGKGAPGGGGGGACSTSTLALAFLGSTGGSLGGTTLAGPFNMGSAASRLAIVAVTNASGNSRAVSSVTVGATSLTQVVPVSAGVGFSSDTIFSGVVTLTGTQTVTMTVTSTFDFYGMWVWCATGLSSNTVKNTLSAAAASGMINITAGDFMVAVSGSSGTFTGTDTPTNRFDTGSGANAAEWNPTITTSPTYSVSHGGGNLDLAAASYR